MFDVESFWIYQDTTSLLYDTTTVISYESNVGSFISGPVECSWLGSYERIDINFKNSSKGTFSKTLRSGTFGSDDDPSSWYSCKLTTLDSLVVNSTTYYNVKIHEARHDSIQQDTYWVDAIGAIRFVTYNPPTDTQTRDLINHEIKLFPNPF